MLKRLWSHRELIAQLTKREIEARYRGSFLGILWTLATPLLMLAVYAFVFGVIFGSRWQQSSGNQAEFVLILFCGLSVFNIFGECVVRAPTIVLANPSYVKRVVFPLEILAVTIMGTALFHGLIGLLIILIATMIVIGHLSWMVLLLPLVLIPLLFITLGLVWFLASLGVFLRDIAQVVPVFVSALLFMSPIFYPVTAIPAKLRIAFAINPMTYIVDDVRQIILWGNYPNWNWIIGGTVIGLVFSYAGNFWFQKTKKGFADVI